MTYKGHVEKGAIVLDEPVTLEDGTPVTVELTESRVETGQSIAQARLERYKSFIGALDDMPEDWSENHDKYLREEHRS